MAKSKNFDRKIFSVEIDSECFETYFKTKISKSKIFPRVIFFCSDSVVFRQKWPKLSKNDKVKKFWSKKFFWSESIQNVSKLILNQKSRIRKFFPVYFFSRTLSFFGQNSNKMTYFLLCEIESDIFTLQFAQ